MYGQKVHWALSFEFDLEIENVFFLLNKNKQKVINLM